jgi:hypothetical protein
MVWMEGTTTETDFSTMQKTLRARIAAGPK